MSLPTVDDAYNAACDEPPFSNADEGYPWLDRWCGRCIHERPCRMFADTRPTRPAEVTA